MFGVCCTNPTMKPDEESTDDGETEQMSSTEKSTTQSPSEGGAKLPQYPIISNWPPPLPTHPPDHTIPPLPTHPPSPSPIHPIYTVPTSKPTKATTSKPSRPTYRPTYPTYKPPSKPTTKPTIKPTTQASPPFAGASCGAKNGYQEQERIVGGHNAEPEEWPWIAALFNGGRQFCGGSLIDDIHILSAAHCVAQYEF